MDESIELLDKAQIFSTLDGNSGYWQIERVEKVIDKTAFVTHNGLFKFTLMPFRLKNAPATFQYAMDVILALVKRQNALVYINIIIFPRTLEEHLKHIDEVLLLLIEASVKIELKKCHFYGKGINHLGHVIALESCKRRGKQQKPSRHYNTRRLFPMYGPF